MFYYLYQITNKVNGKIYVGVHKTNNLDDGYMGSGKVIRAAIAKHSVENFTKVILEHFEDSKAMYAREAEVVTEEFLLREDVYNLRRGGSGGFDYLNKTGLRSSGGTHEGTVRGGRLSYINSLGYHSPESKIKSINSCRNNGTGFFDDKIRSLGRQAALDPKAREKRKITYKQIKHQQGEKNSQSGTMWITNGIESKKIKKTDIIPAGYVAGRRVTPKECKLL